MVAPLIGAAARMVGKKLAKKQLDEVPDYFAKAKAAEKTAKAQDIAKKVGIGAGTVALAPVAAKLGDRYGDEAQDIRDRGIERREKEKLQKQYEDQDKQEGRRMQKGNSGGADSNGMKKGGSVSSASKRADGCAMRGKTKGRMV